MCSKNIVQIIVKLFILDVFSAYFFNSFDHMLVNSIDLLNRNKNGKVNFANYFAQHSKSWKLLYFPECFSKYSKPLKKFTKKLKSYKKNSNGFSYLIVILKGCSIRNLLHLLEINETADLRIVSNGVLCLFRKESILVHLVMIVFVLQEFSRS